ncbi:Zn-ribbon domain-containing OB-fold protein [Denitratisoma oestradiolicum]|uniref:DNA-binding protein n=1 Tax=Denitratisoma oestradiolicum TaxID=311182 RepID=A0A6S6Y0B8_9PROT|nr:OB-fold domain-containing protein [Denitratisoma oestradiolicum]TWO81850.1 hypothetical protein CBW56_03875 [Denitratisoma oestradiolicum]CAB1370818.1 conserved protein of unknown function [Denitratisoma oestradiolicum]
MSTGNWVLPDTDDPVDGPFWQAAREKRLVVQHCAACVASYYPPRVHCPRCHGALAWNEVAGTGRVWSYVTVHPPLLPAYQPYAPYQMVLVELDDHPGLRLVGNLLQEDEGAINDTVHQPLSVGDPVRVAFRTVAEDVVLPCWIKAG